jgi:hypothetical protein
VERLFLAGQRYQCVIGLPHTAREISRTHTILFPSDGWTKRTRQINCTRRRPFHSVREDALVKSELAENLTTVVHAY